VQTAFIHLGLAKWPEITGPRDSYCGRPTPLCDKTPLDFAESYAPIESWHNRVHARVHAHCGSASLTRIWLKKAVYRSYRTLIVPLSYPYRTLIVHQRHCTRQRQPGYDWQLS